MKTFGKLEARKALLQSSDASKATRSKALQVQQTLNHRSSTLKDKRGNETPKSEKQDQNRNNSCGASPKIT